MGASVLTIAAGVLVGLSIFLYFGQDSLIFFRQPLDPGRRDSVLLRFANVEEVNLVAEDGTRLHGFLSKPPAVAGTKFPLVIYFGGNAEEASWLLEESERPQNWAWLVINYRGYGWSEGSPGEKAMTADARRIHDWCRSRTPITTTCLRPRRSGARSGIFSRGFRVLIEPDAPTRRANIRAWTRSHRLPRSSSAP